VLNNPVNGTDPSGHDCTSEHYAESPALCGGGGGGNSIQEPLPPCGTGCGYGKGAEEGEGDTPSGSSVVLPNDTNTVSAGGMGSTSGGSNWGAPNPGTGYYRGGSDLTPRVGVDVRVDKQTGELRPGRGISLFDDPDHPKLQ
jgi:hypothetical protein